MSTNPQDRITINVVQRCGDMQTEIVVGVPSNVDEDRFAMALRGAQDFAGRAAEPPALQPHPGEFAEGLRIDRESGAKWPVDALHRLALLAGVSDTTIPYHAPEALEQDIAFVLRRVGDMSKLTDRIGELLEGHDDEIRGSLDERVKHVVDEANHVPKLREDVARETARGQTFAAHVVSLHGAIDDAIAEVALVCDRHAVPAVVRDNVGAILREARAPEVDGAARNLLADAGRAKRDRDSLREIDEVLERYDVQTAYNVDVSRAALVAGVCEASAQASVAKRTAEGERDVLLNLVEMIVAEARSDDPDAGAVRERISAMVAEHRAPKPVDPDEFPF